MESPNSESKGFYIIPVHNLASDGEPVWPTPAATPVPTATPVPVIADGGSVVDIISGYPWPVDQALRIAWCESRYDPLAYNQSGASGVFQIMPRWHGWRLKPGESLFDPMVNVRIAYEIWASDGGSFRQWVCQ